MGEGEWVREWVGEREREKEGEREGIDRVCKRA